MSETSSHIRTCSTTALCPSPNLSSYPPFVSLLIFPRCYRHKARKWNTTRYLAIHSKIIHQLKDTLLTEKTLSMAGRLIRSQRVPVGRHIVRVHDGTKCDQFISSFQKLPKKDAALHQWGLCNISSFRERSALADPELLSRPS